MMISVFNGLLNRGFFSFERTTNPPKHSDLTYASTEQTQIDDPFHPNMSYIYDLYKQDTCCLLPYQHYNSLDRDVVFVKPPHGMMQIKAQTSLHHGIDDEIDQPSSTTLLRLFSILPLEFEEPEDGWDSGGKFEIEAFDENEPVHIVDQCITGYKRSDGHVG